MAAAVASQAQGIESRIRTIAQTKRIRIKDYFQDFDKLKGGGVTGEVFVIKTKISFSHFNEKSCCKFTKVFTPFFSSLENQFFRCLCSALGLQIDSSDVEALKQKYMKTDGLLNYMQFCNEIDLNFNPKNLRKDPRDQTFEVPELYVFYLPLNTHLYFLISSI